jgi:hypothetical protein
MSKLQELQAQQAAIEKAIAEEKTKGKKEQIAIVRDLIKHYEITLSEVKTAFNSRKKRGTAVKRAASTTASGKRRGRPPVKKA